MIYIPSHIEPVLISEKAYRTEFMRNKIEQEKLQSLPISWAEEVNSTMDPPNPPRPEKRKNICKFFRKGTCKYGLKGKDCLYTHPSLCKKFTSHGTHQRLGCNMGKTCSNFHPIMCMDSLRKRECFNELCNLNHIKGTKRRTNHDETKQTHHESKSKVSFKDNIDTDKHVPKHRTLEKNGQHF